MEEKDFLCPSCRENIKSHLIMQCACCQTIVNYLEPIDDENQTVIMLNQCPNCAGFSKEDWGFEKFFRENTIL